MADDEGIALHHGADVLALPLLVRRGHFHHHGHEDAVHALVDEVPDVAVGELCGEAHRIGGDKGQALFKHLPAALVGELHVKAQGAEIGGPEGTAVPKFQAPGDADGDAPLFAKRLIGIGLKEPLFPHQKEVRCAVPEFLSLSCADDAAPLAAVARDPGGAAGKADDGALAVVGAVGTDEIVFLLVGQVLQTVKADEGRPPLALHAPLGQQGDAQRAHLPWIGSPGDGAAQILLQGAKDSIVAEGAALCHDLLAQDRLIRDADHFGKYVFDDGAAKTRADVLSGLAVALLGDDGGVHEDRAAASQHCRVLGGKGRRGDALHTNVEGGCKILQKGAAAGGAGLIEHDIGDDALMDPDGLHVLAADIQDEAHIRLDLAGRRGVGHSLHRMVVCAESAAQEPLAVAGGAKAQDLECHPHGAVFALHLHKALLHHPDGVTLVVGIEAVDDLFLLVDEDEFRGGAAGVDADVHRQDLPRLIGPLRKDGQGVGGLPGFLLLLGGKEGLCRFLLPWRFHLLFQRRQHLRDGLHLPFPTEKHLHGKGGAAGHDGIRILGADHVLFLQIQPLHEDPHQRGVIGQGTALKDDGGLDLQALGKTADGLLDDGMEGGEGDVLPPATLVQNGLDICLGKDAAAAGDAVDRGACRRQGFKVLRRHLQKGGDLVDERAGAAGAASVHAHVGGGELLGLRVEIEEDDLGVLAPQFNGRPGLGVEVAHGAGVGHHLLDIVGPHLLSKALAAGAADRRPESAVREFPLHLFQEGHHSLALLRVVAALAPQQHFPRLRFQHHGLYRGGAYIYADLQISLVIHTDSHTVYCKK